MNSIVRLVPIMALLVLMLNPTPSWGQTPVCASPGCNPTVSDAHANTAGGTNALMNVLGFFNTAFGSAALQSTSTGGGNTAVGQNALTSNGIGEHNTASGAAALETNLTGSSNTAEGAGALESNTTGSFNTATGSAALITNDTGLKNTAVGAKALNLSTGSRNIAIGFLAGSNLMAGNHNIYVGNPGVSSESQAIRIGTAQAQTFIAGIGATPVSGAIVMVDTGTGQLGIGPPSSARYKQDIETMGHRSAGVLQLRPVTFAYRGDAAGTAHYGLVAEEVAAVYPELVVRAATGEVQTVKYLELIPMLLNELQHEHQARQEDRAAMASLRSELAELRALMGSRLEK